MRLPTEEDPERNIIGLFFFIPISIICTYSTYFCESDLVFLFFCLIPSIPHLMLSSDGIADPNSEKLDSENSLQDDLHRASHVGRVPNRHP